LYYHLDNGEMFRRSWAISEASLAIMETVHGFDSVAVRNELAIVLAGFSQSITERNFVREVLLDDYTIMKKIRSYQKRLYDFSKQVK